MKSFLMAVIMGTMAGNFVYYLGGSLTGAMIVSFFVSLTVTAIMGSK